jgi:alkanesulfonate monooxygenase SsuD/methylene tetrahydromethanopterin reductase-like flavin-dependent oxidoreductase (luciferase family)
MLRGPLAQRRAMLERAADGGLDHVFMADHVSFYGGLGMDGLINAATIGALHESLSVYIGVYLLALRHPLPVARQLSSLCASAPGRVVLGVGVGGEDRHEIEVCGVDPSTRGRRTSEALVVLRGLADGEPFSHTGEFFVVQDAIVRPAPDPPVPIVIGGRSSAAVRRAALHGDGWLGVWCSPRRFEQVAREIADQAQAAGRGPRSWRNGMQIWLGIGDDRDAARERLAQRMEAMYRVPFERFEKYSPYGSAQEIADALAPYVEAGCREFNLMPVAESSEAGIDAVAQIKQLLTP